MKWEDIYSTRITPEKEIEMGRVLLTYDEAEVFAEGTMSVVSGGAKSKKTFALSLLVEQLLTPSEPGFTSTFAGEVLWFDTEMSERRVQMVSKRFTEPQRITFIPIRQYSIRERYEIIEEGIKQLRPELVVIDGYKELVLDINDGPYATRLTNKLLQWTTEYQCHITGVLHTNPESRKPRGALGTELMNKAALTAFVEAKGPKSMISTLLSRDKEIPNIVFGINDEGKPIIQTPFY